MNRLLRSAIDAQYRLYDRMRHREAERAATASGREGPFDELGDSGYLLLASFRRDGTPVPTPVMFSHRDGKVYFRCEPRTLKVKRMRRDPHVRVARCNPRGKPKSPTYEGHARELPPPEHERAWGILRDGYSAPIRAYESTADRLPVEVTYFEVSPVKR